MAALERGKNDSAMVHDITIMINGLDVYLLWSCALSHSLGVQVQAISVLPRFRIECPSCTL